MILGLKFLAVAGLLASCAACARDAIKPETKPALTVEISCDALKTTADRLPTFTVAIHNLTDGPLLIPAPDSFPERAHPDYRGYHAQPLYPVITPVRGPKPTYWVSGNIVIEKADTRIVEIPAGESLRLTEVPLALECFTVGHERDYDGKTTRVQYALLPESAARVAFHFENQQTQINGKNV